MYETFFSFFLLSVYIYSTVTVFTTLFLEILYAVQKPRLQGNVIVNPYKQVINRNPTPCGMDLAKGASGNIGRCIVLFTV